MGNVKRCRVQGSVKLQSYVTNHASKLGNTITVRNSQKERYQHVEFNNINEPNPKLRFHLLLSKRFWLE